MTKQHIDAKDKARFFSAMFTALTTLQDLENRGKLAADLEFIRAERMQLAYNIQCVLEGFFILVSEIPRRTDPLTLAIRNMGPRDRYLNDPVKLSVFEVMDRYDAGDYAGCLKELDVLKLAVGLDESELDD